MLDPALWRKAHLAERARLTRRGMALKAAQGGVNGPAPLGYVNRREGDRTWVEVDPVTGPLIQESFSLAASGHSVRQIAELLASRGLAGKRGGPVSSSTLQHTLRNPFYAGKIRSNMGSTTNGKHDAIINAVTFAKAQAALWKKKK